MKDEDRRKGSLVGDNAMFGWSWLQVRTSMGEIELKIFSSEMMIIHVVCVWIRNVYQFRSTVLEIKWSAAAGGGLITDTKSGQSQTLHLKT